MWLGKYKMLYLYNLSKKSQLHSYQHSSALAEIIGFLKSLPD